jgi:hypothetical protein
MITEELSTGHRDSYRPTISLLQGKLIFLLRSDKVNEWRDQTYGLTMRKQMSLFHTK